MFRKLLYAAIFSCGINLFLFLIVPFVMGMLMTYVFRPDVQTATQDMTVLQSEVSFGVSTSGNVWIVLASFILGILLFLLIDPVKGWVYRKKV